MDWLTGILSSVVGGGVTGILGVIVQRVADYKNKELELKLQESKQDHEVAMRKADAEIMAQEWAARTKIAETEAQGQEAVADSQAFAASFNEPKLYSQGVSPSTAQGWLLILLDLLRGLVRPTLTVYLCVLTTLIYFQAHKLLTQGAAINVEQALQLDRTIIQTVLYLTTTVVCWWFGARVKTQPPKL